jgi:hypothetical protein
MHTIGLLSVDTRTYFHAAKIITSIPRQITSVEVCVLSFTSLIILSSLILTNNKCLYIYLYVYMILILLFIIYIHSLFIL